MVFFLYRLGTQERTNISSYYGIELVKQCFLGLFVRGIQVMHYHTLDKQRGRNGWHFCSEIEPLVEEPVHPITCILEIYELAISGVGRNYWLQMAGITGCRWQAYLHHIVDLACIHFVVFIVSCFSLCY